MNKLFPERKHKGLNETEFKNQTVNSNNFEGYGAIKHLYDKNPCKEYNMN